MASNSEVWRNVGPGPRWGLRFMAWVFGVLPPVIGYALAIGTAWILMMHANPPRFAVLAAMRRMGLRHPWLQVWGVYASFAKLLADRWYIYRGELQVSATFGGEARESQAFVDAVATGEPLVLLGNHLGAMELATAALSGMGRPVKGVLVADEGASPLLALVGDPGQGVQRQGDTITIDGSPRAGLKLLGALRRGEALAFKADRVLPGSDPAKWQTVDFFGEPRPFPRGPAEIARLARARVFAVSVFRVGRGRMQIWTDDLGVASDASETVRLFAAATERQALRAPQQWFNFYPAWPVDDVDLRWLPDSVPPVHRVALRALSGAVAVLVASVLLAPLQGLPTRQIATLVAPVGLASWLSFGVVGAGLWGGVEDRWGRLNDTGRACVLLVPLFSSLVAWALVGGLAGLGSFVVSAWVGARVALRAR